MVNTFVTYRKRIGNKFIPDYRRSAQNLDTIRLWKQCIEASQILSILEDLRSIVEYFGWEECPTSEDPIDSFLKRCEWVRNIRTRYLKLDSRLIWKETNKSLLEIPKGDLPFQITKTDRYIIEGNQVKVWTRGAFRQPPNIFNIQDVLFPKEKILSLGFGGHPIVSMWAGYEDSLKLYINEHIRECLLRPTKTGKQRKCSLPTFKLPEKVNHPWWVICQPVLLSHRAALLRKEQMRGEKIWYSTRKDFFSDYSSLGYIWTSKLSYEQIEGLIKGLPLTPSEICSPISDIATYGTRKKIKVIFTVNHKVV